MYRIATILFLSAAALWTASAIRAAPTAGDNESIDGLKKERLKVADEWWREFVFRDQVGSATPGEEFKAAKALKDAEIDGAQNKQQRIRAMQSYCDRMKAIYDKTEAQSAQRGETGRVAEARIHLLEAKIQLKEEEAK